MNLKNALSMGLGLGLLGTLSSLHAADAVLVQKSGIVTATMPNGSTKELNQGDVVPEGASVTTSPGSVANLEPVAGAVATLQGGTTVKIEKIAISQDSAGTVTKQEVLLDLTSGDLVATIDPSKRAINDFKVATPKGVAAARGTSFSISVSDGGCNVAVTADSVSFTSPTGGSFTVAAGMITITPAGSSTPNPPIPLSQAVSNPAVAAMVSTAVTTVSNVVANNLGGLSSDAAVNLMTQVVGVASNANPTSAASYASQGATAVTSPTSATASTGTQAAAQVAAAAAVGAPGQATAIAVSVTNAVTVSSGATVGSDASAAIAGAVSVSVAAATNTSASALGASVAGLTGNSTTSVASAVATSSSSTTTTGNTANPTAPAQSQTVINVTNTINPSVVSPSGG
jgi:hypothetical protein